MSSLDQNDERRIRGQMVRFQNQAAVRIDNDCVKRREIALGATNPRSQGQEKEKKRLFHFTLRAQLHGLTRIIRQLVVYFWAFPRKPPKKAKNVGLTSGPSSARPYKLSASKRILAIVSALPRPRVFGSADHSAAD